MNFIRKQPSARIIAIGFILVILLGSLLLMLPFSVKSGIKLDYIDALYTAASAVCVTGLTTADIGSTFTLTGQIFIAIMIQIGGLGVTSIGAGVILAIGKKVNLKGRNLVKDSMNLDSGKGIIKFLRGIFVTTIIIEFIGAVLSFPVFIRDSSTGNAIWKSIFHSIASFNNSGFDILGNGNSLFVYKNNILLNIVTCLLVILGGIGFLVIKEVYTKRFKWKKFSMHAKVVISTSAVLILAGMFLLKLTENISWLGAFFGSVSARTAGYATYPMSGFSSAGLIVVIVLMFIGASPGSTGGGIKTTTFFVLLQGIKSSATNKSEKAFKYSIPKTYFRKASVIAILAISSIVASSFLVSFFEPQLALGDIIFEMTSAFGTVGLSTGITSSLHTASKIVSIIMMYIGRLGPLTIASLWYFSHGDRVSFAEGNIAIG